MLVLYELTGQDPEIRFSPHCWKTRMALAHKGLEATCRPWRFTDKDMIAFSGKGTVPVLVDHSETISDSWRIAQHLESRYPDKPTLFDCDSTASLAGFVNAWADTILLPLIARIVILDIHDCLGVADQQYFRTSREKMFGQSLEALTEDRQANLTRLRSALLPLRLILRERPFLSGTSPSYADYCVFGMLMWARCTSATELLVEEDRVFAWRDRLLDAFSGMARRAPRVGACA
jgi:glutathione S-transferase